MRCIPEATSTSSSWQPNGSPEDLPPKLSAQVHKPRVEFAFERVGRQRVSRLRCCCCCFYHFTPLHFNSLGGSSSEFRSRSSQKSELSGENERVTTTTTTTNSQSQSTSTTAAAAVVDATTTTCRTSSRNRSTTRLAPVHHRRVSDHLASDSCEGPGHYLAQPSSWSSLGCGGRHP